jgi:hypothetical protein
VTAADQFGERVGRAQSRVHGALKNWDAGSLPRCEECCELLRGAIGELEGAWQAAEKGTPASAAVRKRLYQLRADVGAMVRLVDASTAFCRGLALLIGAGGNQVPGDSPAGVSAWGPREA